MAEKERTPNSIIKKKSLNSYTIELELPTELQPVVSNIAIKVSTLFTLFSLFF